MDIIAFLCFVEILDLRKQLIHQLKPKFSDREAKYLVDLLMEETLDIKKSKLLINHSLVVDESKVCLLESYINRLLEEEPIQYILEGEYFYGLPFKVNKNVLIPRPETEELVEWIIEESMNYPSLKILDIGTGSGCIPIALKLNLPASNVTAIDVSHEALIVANENANLLNASVHFQQVDILDETTWADFDKFDIIVSNPPYIPHKENALMEGNVLKFEPALALFVADKNPLIFYEKIRQFALQKLQPEGALFFECNEYNAKQVKKLLENHFKEVTLKKDINQKDRMVMGRKF